jgi:thiosulfate/3-mercaptopyruvate sulfurtransferase
MVLFCSACALKPTVATETPARKSNAATPSQEGRTSNSDQVSGGSGQANFAQTERIVMDEKTIVIDARPAFEYSVAHIPRAVNLNWSDFTEPEPTSRGVLQKDTFAIARRLARLGIAPDTKVVVVGRGLSGEGEEGRLAWMLAYLGVKDVRFAGVDSLKTHLTHLASDKIQSVPIWKPELVEPLNVTRAELMDGEADNTKIIDVRPEAGAERYGLTFGHAVILPWRQFFAEGLRVNPSVKAQLEANGITPSSRVIVIGNDGVSSAAVTMALLSLGYSKAGNYAGGFKELQKPTGLGPKSHRPKK